MTDRQRQTFMNKPTAGAPFGTGEESVDFNENTASPLGLVLQLSDKLTPVGTEMDALTSPPKKRVELVAAASTEAAPPAPGDVAR